jgi:peptidyl-Lys metalloendopeptidase
MSPPPAPKQPSPPASLQCALSVAASHKAGEPVELTFRLTNPTERPLFVLKWHTPLEGLKNNFLEVTRAGTPVEYQGPMFKRGEPQAGDYVTVAPGATVQAKIDASLAYDFSKPGTYRISFPGPLRDVAALQSELPRPLANHQALPVQCPAVETVITAP